jgi:hypothetical protein
LRELPSEIRIPVDELADEQIAWTGMNWEASVESAQTFLRWFNYRMVVHIPWCLGMAKFDKQHADGLNRANHVRNQAETYLEAGDLDTGLAIFTRLEQASTGDI